MLCAFTAKLDGKPTKLLAVPDMAKRFGDVIAKLEGLPRHPRMDEGLALRARSAPKGVPRADSGRRGRNATASSLTSSRDVLY